MPEDVAQFQWENVPDGGEFVHEDVTFVKRSVPVLMGADGVEASALEPEGVLLCQIRDGKTQRRVLALDRAATETLAKQLTALLAGAE